MATNWDQPVQGTRLSFEVWHPNCWAIEATERVGGGILAHAVYTAPTSDTEPTSVNGLFTAFGQTTEEVEALLTEIDESPLAGDVLELQERFGRREPSSVPGNVVREFFLEYDPQEMICPTLLEHGFVHSAPVRIENGQEHWEVCFAGDRDAVETAIDRICEDEGAEVSVETVRSTPTGESERKRRMDTLTSTQREVFELARKRGYYEWPRGVSTRELASELDISKTTLLDHLRKAESKLLDPDDIAGEL
ncbi:transcriptional regulator [Natronorubrum sp. JWXQ-INN-674]|uniref:Transcriptional regulator n=1 Tax=Natronorubrum halalkaliphilum TaxID=2691917 RepID=A0A6B0VJL4_9EURY|nr:helix-turn-helix domain-containing protein [Natronorubrum halalkaliphilum]MXV61734.1 transcriptional regulator [Natronorubrum halalkaliphilum]